MIPKEIIEKWEKEADMLYPLDYENPKNSFETICNETPLHHRAAYIQGRTDQYNEQVREIERLKEMLERMYFDWKDTEYNHKGYGLPQIASMVKSGWNNYKQQHNL